MTWTLLHDACEHDDTKHIIQLAHTHAEDALTKESHGMTPMHVLLYGHPTVSAVTALLEACPQAASDCDLNGDTPLHLACCGPSKEIVELLLDACPTAISMQNNEGLMPLHMACRYNPQNEEIIRLLVDKYPFALLSHIKVGEPTIPSKTLKEAPVQTLQDIVDPSARMSSKSSIDLRFERAQIRDGSYPLHMLIASQNASLSTIELLIEEEESVLTKTNKFGETPLHVAVSTHASEEVIKVLVGRIPAALQMREKRHGNLPIHVAIASHSPANIVEALLWAYPEAIKEPNHDHLTPGELAMRLDEKTPEDILRLLEISDFGCF